MDSCTQSARIPTEQLSSLATVESDDGAAEGSRLGAAPTGGGNAASDADEQVRKSLQQALDALEGVDAALRGD